MIIYKCVISGDEMFSDVYKVTESESGIFYEVEGKTITRSETFDDSLIGANASCDDPTETNDPSTVSGCDIVINHKLSETGFDKNSYRAYIKDYLKQIKKRIEETNPERVSVFTSKVPEEIKRITSDMKSWQFFTGESMNPEAMVGLLNYREDGLTPYMLFFKDGIECEKC